MMVRVIMFSAIFLAAASVPAAAETGDDGGRLVIGQGANSCWAWTRSHEAKAATQGLYTQWVAGFVSGVSWEADDPDILTRMDFDGLMAWMHDYCKANPLAKVTTGADVSGKIIEPSAISQSPKTVNLRYGVLAKVHRT